VRSESLALTFALLAGACARTGLYPFDDEGSGAAGAQGTGGAGASGGQGVCGDGSLDPGEACDDANGSNADSCVMGCKNARCGDGFVRTGVEACDDANTTNDDACTNICALPTCGNGVVDPGEDCDDANLDDTDACLSTCLVAFCGDGFVRAGVEACDDGNGSNTDACLTACVPASCGDGFLWAGVEECDDGNVIPGDGCSSSCQLPFCGDGVVEPGEACDLGPANADRPALEVEQLGAKQAVVPFDNAEDAAIFYDYFSASAHTGFEVAATSRIYFYRDVTTELLSLFVHHHIDAQPCPQSDVDFTFSNVPSSIILAIADDTPSEMFKQSPTTVVGSWTFQNNTDGGVLSGFPLPGSWEVGLSVSFGPAISAWEVGDGTGAFSPLSIPDDLILRAYPTPSACRLDCTVPSCGDGVLDGGEVCDDGNTVGGDGCAADCDSLGG
jgi:cysteine-rich repeat protein